MFFHPDHLHFPVSVTVIPENLDCALKCDYRASVTKHVVGSVSIFVYY